MYIINNACTIKQLWKILYINQHKDENLNIRKCMELMVYSIFFNKELYCCGNLDTYTVIKMHDALRKYKGLDKDKISKVPLFSFYGL